MAGTAGCHLVLRAYADNPIGTEDKEDPKEA